MTLVLKLEKARKNIPYMLKDLQVKLYQVAIQINLLYPWKYGLRQLLRAILRIVLISQELHIDNDGYAIWLDSSQELLFDRISISRSSSSLAVVL